MNARSLLLFSTTAFAALFASACTTHASDPSLPSVTVAVTIQNAVGSTTMRHVTSSPAGIDCTSDGTTTTGVCEMAFSGVVTLDPHASRGVVWTDDSGLLVWTEDTAPDGGQLANWATLNLMTGSAAKRTFGVNYLHDGP